MNPILYKKSLLLLFIMLSKTILKLFFAKKMALFIVLRIIRKLCILKSAIKEIFNMANNANYRGFIQYYKCIVLFYYIKNLSNFIKKQLKNCFECLINQIYRHKPYRKLQTILLFPILFYIIMLGFVLTLLKSYTCFDYI